MWHLTMNDADVTDNKEEEEKRTTGESKKKIKNGGTKNQSRKGEEVGMEEERTIPMKS